MKALLGGRSLVESSDGGKSPETFSFNRQTPAAAVETQRDKTASNLEGRKVPGTVRR